MGDEAVERISSTVSTRYRTMEESNSDITNHQNEIDDDPIENLFGKRFTIALDESYQLPLPESLFKADPWNVEELQVLKDELNGVKNRLNNYNLNEWHAHTNLRNSARDVIKRIKRNIQPEFVTQAWCKFYEVLSTYHVVPMKLIKSRNKEFKSVHLCEAPGAFVASLNHWMQTNAKGIHWDWIATTLNPYYEGNQLSIMIDDDRFIRPTLEHWCFGEDNTGNIMVLRNLDKLVEVSKTQDQIFLVTADGSIDCFDAPGEQESMVAHLHFCETIAACHLLAPGGSFVLKIFTTFECHTVCLLYLLSCCFSKVNLFKPATSKEGNSETYVVCLGFKGNAAIPKHMDIFRSFYECGLSKVMLQKEEIPHNFLQKIIECSAFFKSHQSLVITQNIESFEACDTALHEIKALQIAVADKYIKKYKLKKLKKGEIVRKRAQESSCNVNIKRVLQDSYNEHCKKKNLNPWDKLDQCLEESANIEIHMLPHNSVTFSLANVPEELKLCTGKSFQRVHSSKFCDAAALKLQNNIENIILELGRKVDFPPDGESADLRETINIISKYTVLPFKYTDPYDNHKTITEIYDKLQNIEDGETLILTGYSLLTQFNFGLLYLLGCSFNDVELQMHSVLGCQIILKHYNYSMRIMKHLIDIKLASSNCAEGKTILEVLPMSFLYESYLFSPIINMNNWIMKTYIDFAIRSVKGNNEGYL